MYRFLAVALLSLICLIPYGCERKNSSRIAPQTNPVSPQSGERLGTVAFVIRYKPLPKKQPKPVATEDINTVTAYVYTPALGRTLTRLLVQKNLTLSSTRVTGIIEVPARENLSVALAYYEDETVCYVGRDDDVDVTEGSETRADILVEYAGVTVYGPEGVGTLKEYSLQCDSLQNATEYEFHEAQTPDFATDTIVYSGVNASCAIPGKTRTGSFYYRARAKTAYGWGPFYSLGTRMVYIGGNIVIDTPLPGSEPGGWENYGIRLLSIPGGSFVRKPYPTSNLTEASITLSPFFMSATEITQVQYRAITDKAPFYFPGDDNPAENVTWIEAAQFCNWLSVGCGLDPCYDESAWTCNFSKNGFRLPTESEWEYACRAGTTTPYYTGSDSTKLSQAGWFVLNSGDTPHPVALKAPNAWGLYDMHGNVREFCNDWFGEYSAGNQFNPTGPVSGQSRVLRGGHCSSMSEICRVDYRESMDQVSMNSATGFRIVRKQ